jgi:hypothetical protein
VAAGERIVLVAEHAGQIVGTVQLIIDQPENQPHRADVAKLWFTKMRGGRGWPMR